MNTTPLTHPLLMPLLAQVTLTLVVWLWMYWTRIGAIVRSGRKLQDMADARKSEAMIGGVVNPSDNFENLFELPVLFYAGVLLALVLGDALQAAQAFLVCCAWGFVLGRTLHSLIHCSYNRISHRFTAYFVSSVFLWAFWGRVTLAVACAIWGTCR